MGRDPKWVYSFERVFDFNSIEGARKVQMDAIHFKNKAIQLYEETKGILELREFIQVLCTGCGPRTYEDSVG